MYSQNCNIVNFLINFTFLTATYLSKAWYNLCAESAVKPQSVDHWIIGSVNSIWMGGSF